MCTAVRAMVKVRVRVRVKVTTLHPCPASTERHLPAVSVRTRDRTLKGRLAM